MTRTTPNLSCAAGISSEQRFMRRGAKSQILGAGSQDDARLLRRILDDRDCVLVPGNLLTVQGGRRFLSRRGAKERWQCLRQ